MKRTTKVVNAMIAATTILIIISVFFAIRGFSVIRNTTTASGQDFLLQSTQYVAKIVQLSMKNRHQSLSYLTINENWTSIESPMTLIDNQTSLVPFFKSLNGESETLIYIDREGTPMNAISWDSKTKRIGTINTENIMPYLEKDPSLTKMIDSPAAEQNSDSYFIEKQAYLNFYHAINNRAGDVIGYLIMPLKLTVFYQNFIQDFELEYKGYPMIKDRSMTVVMHPVDEQIGLSIIDGRKELFPTLHYEDLQRLEKYQLEHNEGSLTYKSYWWDEKTPREAEKIGAFEWVDVGMAHWVISINADYRERNDEIINFVIVLFCILLLLLLLIAIFTFFLRSFRKQEKIEEENKHLIAKHQRQKAQHKLEWQLSQRNKLETVGLLTTSIIHDMNNFLTPIIGNLELLMQEYQDQPILHDDLHEVLQSAQKGDKLLSNVMRFSRESDSIQEVVDISSAITVAAHLISGIIPKKIPLKINVQQQMGLVPLEEIDLQNVIYNLITNAYQAVKTSVPHPCIWVTAKKVTEGHPNGPNRNYVILEITDNGPGVPAELQKQIYEPFFTTKSADEGTGLGLFAVASIVAKYDWQLDLRSSPQDGTTFSIRMPLTDLTL
ncbi:GHKL domain-containing protein [Vagococcus sp. BWB3-3]|uniref:histidine kinase n=1 Tax=Vagococcus allomyrinae TaxID=2794353 RepID=A0A940PEP5_9ENTE|nr:sensor histidine kinase [Vagococcus allomyrinae]MBP1043217.1 GHKL domain-containing protein [Vagococcus allomyrinae]